MDPMTENTRAHLLRHYQSYPMLQAEDIFKYLFQSAFGCEHLVSDEEMALAYIRREYESVSQTAHPLAESLDGAYTRVYLSCLNGGLHPKTLTRLFCLSARKEADGKAALESKLAVARALVASGELPLDREDFEKKLAVWREEGYPALHHSEAFRAAYRPAYRVIADRYAAHLHAFAEIDRSICDASVRMSVQEDDVPEEILREVYGDHR